MMRVASSLGFPKRSIGSRDPGGAQVSPKSSIEETNSEARCRLCARRTANEKDECDAAGLSEIRPQKYSNE